VAAAQSQSEFPATVSAEDANSGSQFCAFVALLAMICMMGINASPKMMKICCSFKRRFARPSSRTSIGISSLAPFPMDDRLLP
jgi:hypothetical protein